MPVPPAALDRPGPGSVRPRALPDPLSVLALSLSTIFVTGFSLFVFLAVTFLEEIGGYSTDPAVLKFLPLLALPGLAVGSVVSWRTQRLWPLWVGLLLTLAPVVLAFVLPEALDPSLGQQPAD